MSSTFFEQQNYSRIELVCNNESETIKNADDILYAIKACRRKIKQRLNDIEHQDLYTPEDEKESAVLIRQNQYLEVLLNKEKRELEDIFFPNGNSNCIVPDVFLWYKEPES